MVGVSYVGRNTNNPSRFVRGIFDRRANASRMLSVLWSSRILDEAPGLQLSNRHASILLTSAKAPSVTQLPGPARFCPSHGTPHSCCCLVVGRHASLQGSDPSRGRGDIDYPILGSYQCTITQRVSMPLRLGGVHHSRANRTASV